MLMTLMSLFAPTFDLGRLAEAFVVLTQAAVFLRWIYRRMRNDEIYRVFVKDIATLHLPHVYHGQKKIAQHLGIQLEEQPDIRFIDFKNGH